MLYEVSGDLITEKKYTIFCHQTNCCGVMGAGIAKQIRHFYPEVAIADHKKHTEVRPENMLGKNLYVKTHDGRTCVNLYAQLAYGKTGQYTDYKAFQSCLDRLAVKLNLSDPSLKVAFPHNIGCGYGGGDWSIIYNKLRNFSRIVKQDVYIVRKEG